ncbi:hypothetical protein L1987_58352 [Smallanthus sonchifolius]|uniref:Uncharacterized protein n=1 Tax=Smallanthus sonchifolius TaxID=185202 RepID=A0ACB9DFH7_9ASTR|nr:hypothetical protein L1987_58352 [Smallanthus sonchifolius]
MIGYDETWDFTGSAFRKKNTSIVSYQPEDFNPQSPLFSGVRQYIVQEDLKSVAGSTQCWGLLTDGLMDFDEYEYLEKMVENTDAPKSEQRANDGEETVKNEDKERRHSSRHRSDKNNDDRRSKRAKSGEELRDREKERGSSHHRSSPKDGDRDRQRSHRETRDRDRDRERDRVRGRRDHEREREEREKDKEPDRTHRSGSRTERQGNERDREKSRDREIKDREKEREREKEKEKEREIRESDRESRRHKDKKEGPVEPEVDPERDQRTVFAYQISLKADERDVYEFFSRAGKVRDVRLIMDRNSRRSKGVGYIEFYDAMSVPMAIALSGQPLLGHPVMVKPSEAEKNLVQSTATVGGVAAGATGGARKLYVGNLHYNMKEDQLRQVFESFGTVELVQLPTDETGNCKGFGFIQFARVEDARAAQSLNGQLEIAGRMMKVSAITDQPGMQEVGVNPGDFDDDDGGGLALNAHSRALLMQKLDRSGTATSGVGSLGIPTANGTGLTAGVPAIASMPIPPVTVPSIESVGIPSECLLLNNMFDPELEDEPDFDLDIKEDVQSECSKHGKLKHIYVEKNSAGFVYLRFENTQSAVAAQRALHGRWFAGKMITASFMVPQNYEAKFPDSI